MRGLPYSQYIEVCGMYPIIFNILIASGVREAILSKGEHGRCLWLNEEPKTANNACLGQIFPSSEVK